MSLRKLVARAKVVSDAADEVLLIAITICISFMYALIIVGCLQRGFPWLAVSMMIIALATVRIVRSINEIRKINSKDNNH